jgi:hypothetical protein
MAEYKKKGGWGGARPNSGRPAGSATARTREIANELAAKEETPLHYMIKALKHYAAQNDWEKVIEAARAAAPYLHPRLQSMELTGEDGKDLIPPSISIILDHTKLAPAPALIEDDDSEDDSDGME